MFAWLLSPLYADTVAPRGCCRQCGGLLLRAGGLVPVGCRGLVGGFAAGLCRQRDAVGAVARSVRPGGAVAACWARRLCVGGGGRLRLSQVPGCQVAAGVGSAAAPNGPFRPAKRAVWPCRTGRFVLPDGPCLSAPPGRPSFARVCAGRARGGHGPAWALRLRWGGAPVGQKKASCRLRSRQEDGLWLWRGRWLLPAPQCGPRPVTATRAPRRSRRCGGRSRRALPARRRRGSRSPWASCRSSAV